jgi:predicted phage-related endonuclease
MSIQNNTKEEQTMSNTEIITTIRELRELQALIDEAQQEAEAKKDIIKAHMGDDEVLRAGEYKVTWKPVASNRFDSTAFKSTHAELYKQYCKESVSRRFVVA